MRWMTHTLVIVNQIDAMGGIQWARSKQAVIHVFLADLSSESHDASAVELSGVNGLAFAAI